MTSKQIERRFELIRMLFAVLIALGLAFLCVILASKTPFEAIKTFVTSPLSKWRLFSNVLEEMIPLTSCGVAIAVMYQANQLSMIGQSCFHMGSMLGAYVAIYSGLPLGLNQLVTLLIGAAVGALIAGIPAIMKVKWRAQETVSSIMLNYVFQYFAVLFMLYILKDPDAGGVNQSARYPDGALWPKFFAKDSRLHWGVIVPIIIVIAMWFFVYKTKWGYAIRITGRNASFARYSGIAVTAVMLYSQMIGGAIFGMAGINEAVSGLYARHIWELPPTYAADGMMVGLLAKQNPILVPIAAFFLAYMKIGATAMQRATDVPVEFVSIVQSLVIMLIAANMFLAKWKHKMIVKNAQRQLEVEEAN